MSRESLLEVKDVGCYKTPGQPIFAHANLTVKPGDVIVLRGKSGSGKTTLLKCISHLNLYDGHILYRGKTPQSYGMSFTCLGIPTYRIHVLYVPQRPSLLPGSPRDFLNTISSFKAHANSSPNTAKAIEVGKAWGIDEELWDRNWGDLSGGEAQRIALAAAVGLEQAEILLLDEPTSALDAAASQSVERYLVDEVREGKGRLKALIWITHSDEQGQRVATRVVRITAGGLHEEDMPRGA
ncbi:uncharacterized protein PHACADRAFT_143621 [Phanerochaete carnosa HHB-10118-sp]|uniref:ABC transporter domain-containing protein n=1 Tax=Phanerochaete carnosa (strain HHB-10118-sp) TaxID=650164 RepID=K5W890_PHACS|nr:uncharacterized protein PHACADRAFT_143621 [Phanerochaete carnosa HHB-10118-sp]EKM55370.1 hypothetical protein PHACADRAFT_143621 [Phanerochaete carnosa HHB-10118-sp]